MDTDRTRIVWITMLALADKNGEVQASIPGLARIAGVPLPDCEEAINKFLGPDPYSRTPDDEGRRIEKIDGGWALLNHAKYREMASREESKEANAIRQKRHYDKKTRNLTHPNANLTPPNASVTHTLHIADADTEADTFKKLGESATPSAPAAKSKTHEKTDVEWLADLAMDPTYNGICISTQWGKMARWCEVNRKQATRKRFINWLGRCEKPMTLATQTPRLAL